MNTLYKQNGKIKTDQQWVERKNLFYFENGLSFALTWSEQKTVNKIFLVVRQQTNKPLENVVGGGGGRGTWSSCLIDTMTHRHKISKENMTLMQ